MATINFLLKEKDNIEKIRDRLALIIKMELVNQYELANNYTPEPGEAFDPEDYSVEVYVENKRPWEIETLPLVNILVLGEKSPEEHRGNMVDSQNYIAQFQIDCYARGRNSDPLNPILDDAEDANTKAWITARLVRCILMAAGNAYFGMQGIVRKRIITARTTVDMDEANIGKAATAFSLCRIILEIETFESSPQGEFEIMDGMELKVSSADGRVILADLKTPPYKEED